MLRLEQAEACSRLATVYLGIENIAYDPSAGSPTETLLRLLLPLRAPVRVSFRRAPSSDNSPLVRQSKNLTGTLNR